jgi:hypothetical protein
MKPAIGGLFCLALKFFITDETPPRTGVPGGAVVPLLLIG